MQFTHIQQEALRISWGPQSWFYKNISPEVRIIVETAYGLNTFCTPNQQLRAQEDMGLVMAIFARKTGCQKSQAVHALLSGSITHLMAALGRIKGNAFSEPQLKDAWESAFRASNVSL